MGLGAALGIASNAIDVFSTGIQVTGQNIANANTPGYILEQLQLTPGPSYGVSPLILGTGVRPVGVTQQVNQFLQSEILSANSNSSASSAVSTAYTNLQQQINSLGGSDLATQLNNFAGAINNLANQPESSAVRTQAVAQGAQLVSYISTLRTSIDQQRQNENSQVQQLVTQANSLIKQIAQLNPEITKSESSGLLQSQAGTLRDQRYEALNQLSQILPITYEENTNGSINVYMGSDYLVLGGQTEFQQLQTVASGSEGVPIENVQLSITGREITANSSGTGSLIGTLQGRDNVMGGFVQNLDTLTSNMIFQFNKVYSSGQGTQGYTSLTSNNTVTDPTAALNNAGLTFSPQTGSFQLEVTNTTTGLTNTSTINVNLSGAPTDTSLNSLATALNGVANVSATVTPDGHLQINAGSGYQVEFANDTSNVLASLGLNTFFTGSDSSTIGIDSAVANNPNLFASAQGGGPSDGTNALALSQFASTSLAGLNGQNMTDYYNSAISGIANNASTESALSSSQQDYLNSLTSQQQQFSGVSLDEEAIQIMQYQNSYQAAAKLVSTIDKLFQTLIQI
jgi:flagellar hook-associated protein 1